MFSDPVRARAALFPRLILALLLAVALLPGAAAAASLDEYRVQGVIAERFDGYVQVRAADAPAEARQMVDQVNAERRQIYQRRAQAQNVPASEVGKVYAAQIVENAPKGTYFLQPDGSYTRK